MSFRGSFSRSFISTARSSLRSPPTAPTRRAPILPAPRANRRRFASFAPSRFIGKLGCVQSLLPLHSVVALPRLTSHLSVNARAFSELSQDMKEIAQTQMEAAIVALSKDLAKLRTGRASAGMLDHIIVETPNGVKVALNHVAVVSVLDAQTLSVTPYDSNLLKAVERAITSSPLGLNPKADGERLIAAIPPLTKENIHVLCRVVAKSAEDVKQSIRRARQKALDSIKKASSSLPKDDIKRQEKEVEEMTKRFIKSAEDMCKAKEKELAQR